MTVLDMRPHPADSQDSPRGRFCQSDGVVGGRPDRCDEEDGRACACPYLLTDFVVSV